MAFLFDAGIFSVEGLSGEILPSTKLYWYESGTSTPLATYSNEALTTPNANPVLSDSEGRFPSIWLQDANYKLVMELPNGTQRTRDPIRNPGDGVFVSYTALASTDPASSGAGSVGYAYPFLTLRGSRTVLNRLGDAVSIRDGMIPTDGVDTAAAFSDIETAIGGATGSIGFGEIVIPRGDWLLSSTSLSNHQSLGIRGEGRPIIRWNGAAGGTMFQVRDASYPAFRDLILLGKPGAIPGKAIYFEAVSGDNTGTNEKLIVENVKIGRRWNQDSGQNTGFVDGIHIGGSFNGNNDEYTLRGLAISDCSNAGINIANAQSIWSSIENTILNANGTGIIGGSNTQMWNVQFNRNTVADFAPFRDTEHHIFGFYAENPARVIDQSLGASVHINGGKVVLTAATSIDTYWAKFAQTNKVLLENWLVDPFNTTGQAIQFNGSSGFRGDVTIRNCSLPNGETRAGYEFNATLSSCGHKFDIQQGDLRMKGTLDGSVINDPASMADGGTALVSHPMAALAGLVAGDGILVSFSNDVQGVLLTGNCYADNSLYARFHNKTGATVDLASGKLKWRKIATNEQKAKASVVHDFPIVANDSFSEATIPIPCAPGDFVYWGTGIDTRTTLMSAYVSAANTVKLNLTNLSGGNLDLASSTYTVYVIRENEFNAIGAAVIDPSSIPDDDGLSIIIPVLGAMPGDMVVAAFGADLQGLAHTVYISAANTASVRLHNATGVAVDLGALAIRVGVWAMPS